MDRLRLARLVWFSFVAAAMLCIFVAKFLPKPAPGPLDWRHWCVAAGCIATSIAMFAARRRLMAHEDANSAQPDWFSAQLIALYGSMSVVLYGVFAEMQLHAPVWFSAIFYLSGLALLGSFWPQHVRRTRE